MNLSSLLAARTATGKPIRIGLIGAGKFGSMVLAQAKHIPGYQIVGIAELDADKARASLARTGWEAENYNAHSMKQAVTEGTTCLTTDATDPFACDAIECIIEATGHPLAGLRHGLAAIDAGKHVIMVNVEADVLCGSVLADRARTQGVVYSMAYGDQPAAMCELVDWVHNCGFELVSAGKGMNFAPPYRYSTPDTVWDFFGWSAEEVAAGTLTPRCITPLPTAPRPRSKWPPSPMPRAWIAPTMASRFIQLVCRTSPPFSDRKATVEISQKPVLSTSPPAANMMAALC